MRGLTVSIVRVVGEGVAEEQGLVKGLGLGNLDSLEEMISILLNGKLTLQNIPSQCCEGSP